MIRICALIGICTVLLGCGPRDQYLCDGGHSAVAHARSLSQEQLSGLNEQILYLRRQYPQGLLMAADGAYPISEEFGYLDALTIELRPGWAARIKLGLRHGESEPK